MNADIALAYMEKRTCELGYGSQYTFRVRHLVLQPIETRTLSLQNHFMILLEPYCDKRIESYTGVFDLSEDLANELQYEHKGDITVTNQSIFINQFRFIQVIPNFCKTVCQ